MGVAVLFARADSIYKTMPQCDVWDAERDALKWPGGSPVVAHPPCRLWGNLRHMAFRAPPEEKELARWAVKMVRQYGGVVEHPRRSQLWPELGLPLPGCGKDEFGGWTLGIQQKEFGHRAPKETLLYIVGIEPANIPSIPLDMSYPTHRIGNSRTTRHIPEVSKSEREHTPEALARWLVELAERVGSGL